MTAAVHAHKSVDQSAVRNKAKSVTRQIAHATVYAERAGVPMMRARRLLATALLVAAAGTTCSSRPQPLRDGAPVLSVCESGRQPAGERIVVKGELATTGERTITMTSGDALCSQRGAGLLFVTAWDRLEFAKIADAQPRSKRMPITPGAIVTVEGDVTKVDDGRFVTLDRAIVR